MKPRFPGDIIDDYAGKTIGLPALVPVPVMDEAVCRLCRKPIYEAIGAWWHEGDHGQGVRGCRAATYVPDHGWDDAIPKTWTAEP